MGTFSSHSRTVWPFWIEKLVGRPPSLRCPGAWARSGSRIAERAVCLLCRSGRSASECSLTHTLWSSLLLPEVCEGSPWTSSTSHQARQSRWPSKGSLGYLLVAPVARQAPGQAELPRLVLGSAGDSKPMRAREKPWRCQRALALVGTADHPESL